MASTEGSDSDPTHNQSTQQVPQSNTKTNSPNQFFLSAIENPGNILVTQPLLGMKNYQEKDRILVWQDCKAWNWFSSIRRLGNL